MLENTTTRLAPPAESQVVRKLDVSRLLDEHGDYLFRYALGRVADESTAEDLVQETLLAALKGNGHSGKSSERTWLTAILKHKVIDHFRKSVREVQFSDEDEEGLEMFREDGHWKKESAPRSWGANPADAFEAYEFGLAVRRSLSMLPPRSAAVFVLREIEGMTANEICRELQITDSNLWVTLHRARLQLRSLLEKSWFDATGQNPA